LGVVGTAGYAGALIGLGNVALAGRDLPQARARFRAVLAARACTAWEKTDAIAGLAQVCAAEGHLCCGVELLAFVAAHPFTSAATRERTRTSLRELAAELPSADFSAATSHGRAVQIEEVVARLVRERDQKV
jgi:hypothetical protein